MWDSKRASFPWFRSCVFSSSPDAKPRGNEVELYNYLAAVLGQSKTVIEKLRTYNAVGGAIAKVWTPQHCAK